MLCYELFENDIRTDGEGNYRADESSIRRRRKNLKSIVGGKENWKVEQEKEVKKEKNKCKWRNKKEKRTKKKNIEKQ